MIDVVPSIIPAILEDSLQRIEQDLASMQGVARSIHLDICDGLFDPSKTWPFAEPSQKEQFEKLVQEKKLPWQNRGQNNFSIEAHLMVADSNEAFAWIVPGVERIILHSESKNLQSTLQTLAKEHGPASTTPILIGIAIAPDADPDALTPFEGLYQFVHVMGIKKVGFQGQPFDTEALELLRRLRSAFPTLPLQIDGGVGALHLGEVIEAGATRIIEGSSIFDTPNPKEAFEMLQKLANAR